MNDCSNVEVRDWLPELVNGRLSGLVAERVRTHVAECATCQAELAIIEGARAVIIATTPRIDSQRIVHALAAMPARPAASRWSEWRIAAAIALLAVGGAGLYANGAWRSSPAHDTLTVASRIDSPATVTAPEVSTAAELPVAGSTDGLTDEQLRALVDKIGRMDALPSAEIRRPTIPLGGVVTPDGSAAPKDPQGAM